MQQADQTEVIIPLGQHKNNIPKKTVQKKVLIVDDEKELLFTLHIAFAHNSTFEVLTANNGREALSVLEGTVIDLLVLDIGMPEMDGMELLLAMSDSFPEIPSIVMTAYGNMLMEEQLKKAGTVAVLEKPMDIDTLERAILKALSLCSKQYSCFPLEIFLQLLAMEQKTVHLKVFRADGRQGSFFFQEGFLVDAESDPLTGDKAVLEMMEWKNFTLGVKEFPNAFPEQDRAKFLNLLLETLYCPNWYRDKQYIDRARQEFIRIQQQSPCHDHNSP
jgi:two-component system, response regulator, stage 0 sporulation protein F